MTECRPLGSQYFRFTTLFSVLLAGIPDISIDFYHYSVNTIIIVILEE
ncbi:UNVERIFIED_CONTAM: hypothetical protein POZ17_15000 [Ralstonia mannitolilytica]